MSEHLIPSIANRYVGRFAPSPTGPLHFGSLVAATASYLDAKAAGGDWLVRMEDLDHDREQPGAAAGILRDLEAFGFQWDGPVMYQNTRDAVYREAFEQLDRDGMVYACGCSRKEIADSMESSGNSAGLRYPGTCRAGVASGRIPTSWRVHVGQTVIRFDDCVQGACEQNLAEVSGDFVVKRVYKLKADSDVHIDAFAYQLAVVVDDAAQGVTHVVRGADLLDSTPRQIYLQRLLKLGTPSYTHIPAAVDANGFKLSKQTEAAPLNAAVPVPQLIRALEFLGQQPQPELREGSEEELWRWAVAHWSVPKVPAVQTQTIG